MGLSTKLAYDLSEIRCLNYKDKEQLRTLIIDFFAAAYAGYANNSYFNKIVEKVVLSQGGIEESTVMFTGNKYPARISAFINSVYGHGAELDDGNKKAAGHAGVHLIPSVFSLAEKLSSSNEDVLLALATGYEAFIRISSAAQPGMVARGFHSTGMAGTLACAAACSRLYHCDVDGIENSIALATTMSGGLLSYGDSRPEIKPLNPGKAAENGVFAAMLASEGVKGPEKSLEGNNGWFNAVTDKVNEEYMNASNQLLLHDCYIKLYPSCRHTHCGIDAAIALHGRFDINSIKEINVYIYPNAIKLAGIDIPKNKDETKFSIKYTLARALLNGSYGISDMEINCLTEDVLRLINKINLISDESMQDLSKGVRGTKLEIILINGQVLEKTVQTPKGDPENPLKKSEIINKLLICSEGQASSDIIKELIDSIESIDGDNYFNNPMIITGREQ